MMVLTKTSLSEQASLQRLLGAITVLIVTLLLSSCGGSQVRPCERNIDDCLVEIPPPVEVWWDAPLPDFSENPDRPVISLLGERTQVFSVGEFYLEEGALAADEQDGDISEQIIITGDVDTSRVGDYLVRYAVTDSDGQAAIEQARVIRVIDNNAQHLTRRPLGTTAANFGYFEHLPTNYGEQVQQKPPLLIYLHGSGGNLEFTTDTDPVTSLDAVLENYGVPRLIDDREWNNDLPFVVVAPHLGTIPGVGFKDRLDAFVDYAIHTYDIDVNRVYLTGWSSGGYLSSAYAVDFPEKIAAIAPIASGLATEIEDLPDDFCNIEQVPVWLFHGTGDQITPFVRSIRAYNAIVDLCQPRVIPKLSLILQARHHIHHAVYDLSALVGGSQEATYDPRYEPYDEDIFQWLLSHSLLDR
ncbi:immunoglobulin-like domain-containing protein [Thalassotalea euphylliae]|uniref:DUF5011 domain-containing protein n=1 Tax=Thalassotalea euphylliae TaxID=1655234 RepID=A0A3E0U4M5_9GAMM|nr:immunoglobulin-like domain-containing protein [Thalassotalea euphylliae]REL31654.1 DUF5011 domain-containing protein [Thalassotalea euphylliae]